MFVFLFLHILLFFIRRSYLSLLIIQLCNTMACLFPKLFLDIRFRMMNALLGLGNFLLLVLFAA